MKREIKFRTWNKETNTFGFFNLESFSIDYRGGEPSPVISTYRYKQGARGDFGDYFEFDINSYDFDSYEIEQFTGLKDKNGVDIYDGDIVKKTLKDNTMAFVFPVNWNPAQCGFDIRDGKSHMYEVIGNIHENKDLIK